jgi:hypothetical protein
MKNTSTQVNSVERFLEAAAITFAIPRERLETLLFQGQPAAREKWKLQRTKVQRPIRRHKRQMTQLTSR